MAITLETYMLLLLGFTAVRHVFREPQILKKLGISAAEMEDASNYYAVQGDKEVHISMKKYHDHSFFPACCPFTHCVSRRSKVRGLRSV